MEKGIIYVMKTVVPGLIKIGKTGLDNYEKRMYNLEKNGYNNITGLKRVFAIAVDNYSDKELLLQDIFSKSRVGDTEIFSLDANLVVQLLSSFAGEIIYPKESAKEVFIEATDAKGSFLIPDGIYLYVTKNYSAQMEVINGEFILKKGSTLGELNPKHKGGWVDTRKKAQIENNTLLEDIKCTSPSFACNIVSGHFKNGWECWRNDKGELIDIYRKKYTIDIFDDEE